MTVSHPYYPTDLSLPDYVPGIPTVTSFLILGLAFVLVVLVSNAMASHNNLNKRDRLSLFWHFLSGVLHVSLEFYYVIHVNDITSLETPLSGMWKEYAKSDSRYLTNDPFVRCIETLTVSFIGPICWLTVYLTYRKSLSRYVAELITSVLYIYGVMLYLGTSYFEQFKHVRPEPLYFYVYFMLMNLPWLIVPLYLGGTAIERMRSLMASSEKLKAS